MSRLNTPPSTPLPSGAVDVDRERKWVLASHIGAGCGVLVSAGLLGWVAPLLALVACRKSPHVRAHAVESLNFQLTWFTAAAMTWTIGATTAWLCIGILYFAIAGVITLFAAVFAILGARVAAQGRFPRYPANFRLLQ